MGDSPQLAPEESIGEDHPGLGKLTRVREMLAARRRVSVLVGNGALHLPQELARGADGAMMGFAEILRRRGVLKSAALRAPAVARDARDIAELDRPAGRLERRLAELRIR